MQRRICWDTNPHEIEHDVYAFTRMIHKDDYEKAMQAMRDHIEGKKELYEVEYRIRKKDGSYAWFYDKGGIVSRNEKGEPLKITGLVVDISEAKKRDQEILQIIRSIFADPYSKCYYRYQRYY
ncbi:MAG: PAS domain-containing protein [Bacteroidales bacterium]|nr:PAS domain-containing protein [Bacteroidales bacterium]